MGYFCKIVNEDSTTYRVNSLPIGSLQILNPSYPEEAFITITSNYKKIAESVLEGGIRGLIGFVRLFFYLPNYLEFISVIAPCLDCRLYVRIAMPRLQALCAYRQARHSLFSRSTDRIS